jgi:hypothetical protein
VNAQRKMKRINHGVAVTFNQVGSQGCDQIMNADLRSFSLDPPRVDLKSSFDWLTPARRRA